MTKWSSFKELLWPDCLGWGAAVGLHYLARGIDAAQAWRQPFRRTEEWAAIAGLGAAGTMYTKDMAPDFNEIWFAGNMTLIFAGVADKVFGPPEVAIGGKKAVAMRKVAAGPNVIRGAVQGLAELPLATGAQIPVAPAAQSIIATVAPTAVPTIASR